MVADPCYGRRDTHAQGQANQYMDESTTADAPAGTGAQGRTVKYAAYPEIRDDIR